MKSKENTGLILGVDNKKEKVEAFNAFFASLFNND